MKADKYSRRCEDVRENGEPCNAWAVRDSDPPRCRLHSMTKEEQLEQASRGGRHRAEQRRLEAEPKPRTNLSADYSLSDILKVVAPALTATFDVTGEADWSARLAAAGTILMVFPRHMRSTPEDVCAVLEQALPSNVRIAEHDLHAEQVYEAMREEWDRLRIRHHPIAGLYRLPYPGSMIAPWEDRKAVLGSQPKPEGRLSRTSDGQLVLYRDGHAPLLIEEDTLEELSPTERALVSDQLEEEAAALADAAR
jgi:hypothetical protein